MPVATLMGSAPAALQPLLSMPLPPAQFRYVAAHLGDDGDWDFQRNNDLAWLEPGQPVSGPVHVHFDLDALDPAAFPHVAYPDGRLSMEAGLAVVREAAAGGTLVGLTHRIRAGRRERCDGWKPFHRAVMQGGRRRLTNLLLSKSNALHRSNEAGPLIRTAHGLSRPS